MDVGDFLEADELAALSRPGHAEAAPAESCDGCTIAITWVDLALVCAFGCTWCPECAESAAMVCPVCSGELRPRASRARPLPR